MNSKIYIRGVVNKMKCHLYKTFPFDKLTLDKNVNFLEGLGKVIRLYLALVALFPKL